MPATAATEPLHITCNQDIFGGKPCIAGTRIRVQDIYVWHELQGQSADQIVNSFPQLTHSGVYAALAYFWDHRAEMLAEIAKGDELIEQMKRKYPSKISPSAGPNAVSP
jgi:uncharacterized protein (DUF433 family)